MTVLLYPVITHRLNNKIATEAIPKLLEIYHVPDQVTYGVYSKYESDFKGDYDFSIATDVQNKSELLPISIEDLTFYEVFRCKDLHELSAVRRSIWNKTQQGLLRRMYSVDFEKYYPDGKIEIYISIMPHC